MESKKSWSMHCLNYNNPVRKESMTQRFHTVGISDFTMHPGVSISDPRINPTDHENVKRCHSCMFGHLNMIQSFIDTSNAEYGIFCEDDILIDANFVGRLTQVIDDFAKQNLDVLLLGYLVTHPLTNDNYTYCRDDCRYYKYSMESIWGAQMYMLTRAQAKRVVYKYLHDDAPQLYSPFSSDWTITKEGNCRAIYPMLAIEDGKSTYTHEGQSRFHALSHSAHLNSSTYI